MTLIYWSVSSEAIAIQSESKEKNRSIRLGWDYKELLFFKKIRKEL